MGSLPFGASIKGDRIKSGCLNPAFSRAHMRPEVLRNPYILGGSPSKGDKIKSGCLTPAFSGAHIRVEVLRNPCVLGGPHQRGQEWPVSGRQW